MISDTEIKLDSSSFCNYMYTHVYSCCELSGMGSIKDRPVSVDGVGRASDVQCLLYPTPVPVLPRADA